MAKMKSRCTPERKVSNVGDLLAKDEIQATISNYQLKETDTVVPKHEMIEKLKFADTAAQFQSEVVKEQPKAYFDIDKKSEAANVDFKQTWELKVVKSKFSEAAKS